MIEKAVKPYAFTYYPEGPRHARIEWYYRKNEELGKREHSMDSEFMQNNSCEPTGRIGKFVGGGYSRDLVSDNEGKCQVITKLHGRVVGDSLENIVNSMMSLGLRVCDILPYVVIDAKHGIRLFLGDAELGGSDFTENNLQITESFTAGVHAREEVIPCGENNRGKLYTESRVRLPGSSCISYIHFDFATPDVHSLTLQALTITAHTNFSEKELRDVVDPVLIVP